MLAGSSPVSRLISLLRDPAASEAAGAEQLRRPAAAASPSNSPAGSAEALCRSRLCNCLLRSSGVAMVGVATMVGHTYGAIGARAAHVNLRTAVYRAFCNDRQASIFPSLGACGRDVLRRAGSSAAHWRRTLPGARVERTGHLATGPNL